MMKEANIETSKLIIDKSYDWKFKAHLKTALNRQRTLNDFVMFYEYKYVHDVYT